MYFLEEYWMHHCLLNGSPHWMTSLFLRNMNQSPIFILMRPKRLEFTPLRNE